MPPSPHRPMIRRRDEKSIPILRIPDLLLPRIFHNMVPEAVVSLAACSTAIRRTLVSHRALPFRVETVFSDPIHRISFQFVDDIPCEVSFTVSTSEIDWLKCHYATRQPHLEVEKCSRSARDSRNRLMQWTQYLFDVFAVNFIMSPAVWNDERVSESSRKKVDELMKKRKNIVVLRRMFALSICTNSEEFFQRWDYKYLPRLFTFHISRTNREDWQSKDQLKEVMVRLKSREVQPPVPPSGGVESSALPTTPPAETPATLGVPQSREPTPPSEVKNRVKKQTVELSGNRKTVLEKISLHEIELAFYVLLLSFLIQVGLHLKAIYTDYSGDFVDHFMTAFFSIDH